MDRAGDIFGAEIFRREPGRREQQLSARVDRGAIFLLRPGECGVVGPEPGFDMGDRNVRREGRERSADRA